MIEMKGEGQGTSSTQVRHEPTFDRLDFEMM